MFLKQFFTYLTCLIILNSCDHLVNESSVDLALERCSDGVKNGKETGIDCGGDCPNNCIEIPYALSGEILGRVRLEKSVPYLLTGPLLIRDTSILEIDAGTIIRVMPDSGAYIAVAQGGKLFVFGSSQEPVLFTSDADQPKPGDWGGIIFLGKGLLNTNEIDRFPYGDYLYGGTKTEESSGWLNYVKIHYAGEKNQPALSLNGVNFPTTLQNIEVEHAAGTGIQILGGNASLEKIFIKNTEESGIRISDGWTGSIKKIFVENAQQSGIVLNNQKFEFNALPKTKAQLDQVTLMGPFKLAGIVLSDGLISGVLSNLYLEGAQIGLYIAPSYNNPTQEGGVVIDKLQFISSHTEAQLYLGSLSQTVLSLGETNGAGSQAAYPDWLVDWKSN